MHTHVKEMLATGIIKVADGGLSSPVVIIEKANRKYRSCVDFRKINALTRCDVYPLLQMNAILRKLQ